MVKPGFITLTMKWACTSTCTARHSHHNICIATPAIIKFREVVDDLIETASHEIGKLHFNHALVTFKSSAECGTDNTAFTQRSITYSVFTIFSNEAIRDFKYAAVF